MPRLDAEFERADALVLIVTMCCARPVWGGWYQWGALHACQDTMLLIGALQSKLEHMERMVLETMEGAGG